MWYLLLLVGLASAAISDPKARRTEYHVKSQNLHLDHILEELKELEEEYGKLSDDVDDKTVRMLKARVHNLEDDDCGDHEAECGGDVPECISDLLFCDGTKDCNHGEDEDEDRCSEAVAHVGSSYTGIATWGACEESEPHNAVVTITAAERKEFFPSRIWVRATLSFEEDEHTHKIRTFPLRGYYNFGRHALVLGPELGSKPIYGVKCYFNLGDNDHADCHILVPSTHDECAHFQATRY